MQDCHSDRSEAKWRNLQLFLLGSAAQIFQVPSGTDSGNNAASGSSLSDSNDLIGGFR